MSTDVIAAAHEAFLAATPYEEPDDAYELEEHSARTELRAQRGAMRAARMGLTYDRRTGFHRRTPR